MRNTTCSEQMVYSAIESTCFDLYWPSSVFYNIEEESINAVKTVRGLLIKRSLYQSPDPSVPSARAICKHGEKIINRENSSRRSGDGLFFLGAA